jgi:hypothetical protein
VHELLDREGLWVSYSAIALCIDLRGSGASLEGPRRSPYGGPSAYDMPSGYDIPGCAYYIHLHNCTVEGPTQKLSPPETVVPNEESAPYAQAQPSQSQAVQPDSSADKKTSAPEQSVRDAVSAWVQAFRSKDSIALADSYAALVERYFRRNYHAARTGHWRFPTLGSPAPTKSTWRIRSRSASR